MLNRYFDARQDNIDFVYANAVVENIYFALISLHYILYKSEFDIGIYRDENTYYFFHIQNLLTACGNICNVFYNNTNWNKKAVTTRCARLRREFDVTHKKFPLIFQKEVRNTNEHFDERYEQFNGEIGDYNIFDKHIDQDMKDTIMCNPHLRTFDNINKVYHTYDRKLNKIEYNLFELNNELVKMLDLITNNPKFNSAWIDQNPQKQIIDE